LSSVVPCSVRRDGRRGATGGDGAISWVRVVCVSMGQTFTRPAGGVGQRSMTGGENVAIGKLHAMLTAVT
jgi:hypothetical protein